MLILDADKPLFALFADVDKNFLLLYSVGNFLPVHNLSLFYTSPIGTD